VKVALVTLGCDKNTVDSERYLGELVQHGATPVLALDEADVILVNTCGFIDAAKRESIDAIVEAGRRKVDGTCRAVVAVGCMVQRHRDELREALPEVDFFLGTSDVDRLIPELDARGLLDDPARDHPGMRVFAGDSPHVRYLKISEGCDHGCAFCAIPLMRGRHRSFELHALVREAQVLALQGARELNLVAQDLAHFGRDRRDGNGLPELVSALLDETDVPWIRLLYLYSAGLTPALLELMAARPRLLPYLDMPMQHASDRVLARMRRPERQRTQRERIARIRSIVPDVTIRTTCIVGFPGETEDDFDQLLDFLEEIRFDRVGAFTYSAQEGTRAWEMPDDVPEALKLERLERLNALQRIITSEQYERHIGRTTTLLVDSGPGADGQAVARAPWQADDIDGLTRVAAEVCAGDMIEARIDDVVDDHDFTASYVAARLPWRGAATPSGRALPLADAPAGSFGR
jgi:ribosomal protein S12 methylthiotransferase